MLTLLRSHKLNYKISEHNTSCAAQCQASTRESTGLTEHYQAPLAP